MPSEPVDIVTRLELLAQRMELLVGEFKQMVAHNDRRAELQDTRIVVVEKRQDAIELTIAQWKAQLVVIGTLGGIGLSVLTALITIWVTRLVFP